jgi:hypothetical protein
MKHEERGSSTGTKREKVRPSLELTARLAEQERLLRSARGKLHWDGDLTAMRRDPKQRSN